MMEYIDKEKAQIFLRTDCLKRYPASFANGLLIAADQLNKIPTSDVVEVKHGKWISASKKQGVNVGMKCSLCGARIKYSEFFNGNHNFCHKCGAKMDGKKGRD